MGCIVVMPRVGVVIGREGHAIGISRIGRLGGDQIGLEISHIGLTFGDFFQDILQSPVVGHVKSLIVQLGVV